MPSERQRDASEQGLASGPSRRLVLKAVGGLGIGGVAGCVSDDSDGADNESSEGDRGDSEPAETDQGATASDTVALELIADGESIPEGPSRPLAYETPAGTDGIAYVADQDGTVYVTSEEGLHEEPLLDIQDRVIERESWEQGLVGIEPHPDFADTRKLYVRYSGALMENAPESYSHTFVLSEFQVGDSYRSADPASERTLLEIPEPQPDHNSGTIVFGPDGYLYVGVGDGGSWGDIGEGHAEDWYDENPGGNAQNVTDTLLGGVLRIDVDTTEGDRAYGIPDDNPLVDSEGRDEYYAWGLRNPFRMSFDSDGTLYVGDVGGQGYEEINIVESGGNYGWNVREGSDCQVMEFDDTEGSYDRGYEPGDTCPETAPDGDPLRDPVFAYENTSDAAASVICGYRYENETVPAMTDRFVFADFVPGGFGHLMAATPPEDGERPWEVDDLALAESSEYSLGDKFILSIGQDPDGEIYLTTSTTKPRFGHGHVFKIVPP
jgi:glucose/arabinose dehydrogenase